MVKYQGAGSGFLYPPPPPHKTHTYWQLIARGGGGNDLNTRSAYTPRIMFVQLKSYLLANLMMLNSQISSMKINKLKNLIYLNFDVG